MVVSKMDRDQGNRVSYEQLSSSSSSSSQKVWSIPAPELNKPAFAQIQRYKSLFDETISKQNLSQPDFAEAQKNLINNAHIVRDAYLKSQSASLKGLFEFADKIPGLLFIVKKLVYFFSNNNKIDKAIISIDPVLKGLKNVLGGNKSDAELIELHHKIQSDAGELFNLLLEKNIEHAKDLFEFCTGLLSSPAIQEAVKLGSEEAEVLLKQLFEQAIANRKNKLVVALINLGSQFEKAPPLSAGCHPAWVAKNPGGALVLRRNLENIQAKANGSPTTEQQQQQKVLTSLIDAYTIHSKANGRAQN